MLASGNATFDSDAIIRFFTLDDALHVARLGRRLTPYFFHSGREYAGLGTFEPVQLPRSPPLLPPHRNETRLRSSLLSTRQNKNCRICICFPLIASIFNKTKSNRSVLGGPQQDSNPDPRGLAVLLTYYLSHTLQRDCLLLCSCVVLILPIPLRRDAARMHTHTHTHTRHHSG